MASLSSLDMTTESDDDGVACTAAGPAFAADAAAAAAGTAAAAGVAAPAAPPPQQPQPSTSGAKRPRDDGEDEGGGGGGGGGGEGRGGGGTSGRARSLANLTSTKACPSCGATHGAAKRSVCGAALPGGGTCGHVFVRRRGGPRVAPPAAEELPAAGQQRLLVSVKAAFAKLARQADAFAAATGCSVAVLSAGAAHTKRGPTPAGRALAEDGVLISRLLSGRGGGGGGG